MNDDGTTGDPMRDEQIKMARAGLECRRFLNGIGGAAIEAMRAAAIEELTRLGPKDDAARYRAAMGLKIINEFADTIIRSATQGEEAGVQVRQWLETQQKRGIFSGR